MTDRTPEPEPLGPAIAHRDAAEQAAANADYNSAVRERFRAVVRGLEQGGVVELRRSRTADETAAAAAEQLPDEAVGLTASAVVFDEVVYGGKQASDYDYALIAKVDRFSPNAPPPADVVADTATDREPGGRRRRFDPPDFLKSPKLWTVVAIIAVLLLVLLVLPRSCSVPEPATPPDKSQHDNSGNPRSGYPSDGDDKSSDREDQDTLFDHVPAAVKYGGLQLLVAAVLLALWRARRRGALVPPELPVEAPATELTNAHARLYRRSRDREHVASVLRTSTLRRLLPRLGLTLDSPGDQIVKAVAAQTGHTPDHVSFVLYGSVDDDERLIAIADGLDSIEGEIRAR
ncbi:DUF4129 domain-containing protein [Antrihabitans stalactiti]|uniref:DUF4129 domain-containing protein n=1 Tax=Antrihabitans stalactiti TaxID=2584121 RepID=A0A848K9Q7_9NOCA|nr:DUF4129 domain-containing protein [Antrihabitans stalactiti]NMN95645.1 DUF4129 domain-containing protein [Antrihabitans stalactiti]